MSPEYFTDKTQARGNAPYAAAVAAQAAADAAQATADAAATDIVDLQNDYTGLSGLVDGKAVIWVQNTEPTGLGTADTGDFWVNTTTIDRITKVWSGTAWQDVSNQSTLDMIEFVDSKVTTFYSPNTPTATAIGDLWVDTDDNNHLYRASSIGTGGWVSVRDATIATAQSTATTAQTTADGKNKLYFTTQTPGTTANTIGDVWYQIDEDENVIAQWTGLGGTSWQTRSLTDATLTTITAGKIAAGAITTEKLALGAVIPENIAIGHSVNLISDPSFEEVYALENWDVFGSGPANPRRWRKDIDPDPGTVYDKNKTGYPRSGQYCFGLYVAANSTAAAISPAYPVEGGQTYQFTLYAGSLLNESNAVVQMLSGTGDATSPWYYNDQTLVGDTDIWIHPPVLTAGDPESYMKYSWEFTVPIATPQVTYCMLKLANAAPTAESWLMVDDVSVVKKGVGSTELSPAGLRLFGEDGLEIGAFVSNRPSVISVIRNNEVVARVDRYGNSTFASTAVTGSDTDDDDTIDSGFTVYGTEFREWLEDYSKGVIAFALRDTNSTLTATEAPVQELQANIVYGRIYQVAASGTVVNNTANGRVLICLKYTIDGTTPGTSSTKVGDWHTSYNNATANAWGSYNLLRYLYFPPNGTSTFYGDPIDLRVVLTVAPTGTGSAYSYGSSTAPLEMSIIDAGKYPGDTGIDREGGSPPATRKTYVTSWRASTSETYRGDGSARTDTGDMVQGYYSANGNQHALAIFGGGADGSNNSGELGKTISQALSGATLNKVEVYLYANHWWYNSGGTAIIRPCTLTSLANTTPTGSYKSVSGWGAGVGKYVDITSLSSSSIRSVWLGKGPTTSLTYYGRFNGHLAGSNKPFLRLTYTRSS